MLEPGAIPLVKGAKHSCPRVITRASRMSRVLLWSAVPRHSGVSMVAGHSDQGPIIDPEGDMQ